MAQRSRRIGKGRHVIDVVILHTIDDVACVEVHRFGVAAGISRACPLLRSRAARQIGIRGILNLETVAVGGQRPELVVVVVATASAEVTSCISCKGNARIAVDKAILLVAHNILPLRINERSSALLVSDGHGKHTATSIVATRPEREGSVAVVGVNALALARQQDSERIVRECPISVETIGLHVGGFGFHVDKGVSTRVTIAVRVGTGHDFRAASGLVVNLITHERTTDECPLERGGGCRLVGRRMNLVRRVGIVAEELGISVVIDNAQIDPVGVLEILRRNDAVVGRNLAIHHEGDVALQFSVRNRGIFHACRRSRQVGIGATRSHRIGLAEPLRIAIFINIGKADFRLVGHRDGLAVDGDGLEDITIHFLRREVVGRQIARVVANENATAIALRRTLNGVVPRVVVSNSRVRRRRIARDDNIVELVGLFDEFPRRAVVGTLRTLRIAEQRDGRAT